ncbi:COG1470 family protein [Streptomyces corynorhini]|uniref:Peptidoglycan-binding protein n=1 Tax=Streptomyces corynorhini TaxID=2282652 RepID=A0A370B1I6_9ACTN|nr:hypothetical protein [Streptomyces corynorhini]RDG35471.1 hypothetical protein DVH02_25160 [Streptomyces corynorhini]
MTTWTSLEPASTTVDPGSSTTVRLRLRNTGDVVDEYRFETVGDVAPYVTVEPPAIRLFPGTTGIVELTFAPPRTPDAAAGPHPYGVRVLPTEQHGAATVVEGNVTFTTFVEVRAELVPQTVKGRFRGRPKLAVDNLGNTVLTASIGGGDKSGGGDLSYEIVPSNVQIEPGRAAFVDATLKPRQITWVGQKQERPYELSVRRSGYEPLAVNGTYVQRSLLPFWMMTTLSLLLALTITGLVLWFTYKAPVRTLAQEKLQQAAATALPEEPPEKPKDKPTQEAAPSEEPKASDDGGGGEDKEEEETKEEETQTKQGPLPLTSEDPANLFVQFAQVRLVAGANNCKLVDAYTVGKLDEATEAALTCFQKANDSRYGTMSRLEETDGLGNLGRSTMTALLAAHFVDAKSVPLKEGEESPEVPWVRNILLWGTQVEIDDGDLDITIKSTKANIDYLRKQIHAKDTMTSGITNRIKEYQGLFGAARSGVMDETTLSKTKLGWIKQQNVPGTVTAKDWLPAPMQ